MRNKFVIVFHYFRKVKMHNLWEYTSMRKRLLSKRIYLLMSGCENICSVTNNTAGSHNLVCDYTAGNQRGNAPLRATLPLV